MANCLTAVRMICALVLGFCPIFSVWFYVIYAIGGVSDVLDGITARHFGTETELGAQLDTIADIAFTAVVIIKTVQAVYIPVWLIIWIACIAFIKAVNIIYGFVVYKRFVSEHTMINKICGIILFVIPLCIGILPRRPLAVLIILTCITATLAAVHEGYYIRSGKKVN